MQQGIEAAFWRETQFSINACRRQQLTQSQQRCGRRQPSLHMHCVTEEEAKKRCFVGLHIRPDRHKSYNKRDASEKRRGRTSSLGPGERRSAPSIFSLIAELLDLDDEEEEDDDRQRRNSAKRDAKKGQASYSSYCARSSVPRRAGFRPLNPRMFLKARIEASCTMSAASARLPASQRARRKASTRYGTNTSVEAGLVACSSTFKSVAAPPWRNLLQ